MASIRKRGDLQQDRRYTREERRHRRAAAHRSLERHPLARRYLATIRSSDIAEYRKARLETVRANTVRLDLAVLSHLFTIAAKESGMESLKNSVKRVSMQKRPNGRDRRLEGDEEERLFAAESAD
jgi:hypothetical protein